MGAARLGVFTQAASGSVTFEYERTSGVTPLSLALPIDRPHQSGAAAAWLDGLLPDSPEVRERWVVERALPDHGTFTLLDAYGEDVAGAVRLSADRDRTLAPAQPLMVASEAAIAARITALRHDRSSWIDPRAKPRFSLAGAQAKFTLRREADVWLWPTWEFASTHILKPPSLEHPSIEHFEHATLQLARALGIPAPNSEVLEFGGHQTLVVERFDRAGGQRVHAEDMNQALGRPTAAKYGDPASTAATILRLLSERGQETQFIKQLAFNAAIGNADAHAKNYSVLLAADQVVLAPLYDALPTILYPGYSTELAMHIGAATHPAELTPRNWMMLADTAGLDRDNVYATAREVIESVAESFEDVFMGLVKDTHRQRLIRRHRVNLCRALGATQAPPRPKQT